MRVPSRARERRVRQQLRRPMREVDEQIIDELQTRLTEESFIRAVLVEVRRRLTARAKASESEEAPKLRRRPGMG